MTWKLVFVAGVLILGVLEHAVAMKNFFEFNTESICTLNSTEYNQADIKAATSKFSECMNGIINIVTFGEEFRKAVNDKSYDELFKKYCAKAPQVKACILNWIAGLAPCLSADLLRNAKKSFTDVIEFVCYNDGARIATFFKEDGPKCISEKESAITACADAVEKLSNSSARASEPRGTRDEYIVKVSPLSTCALNGQFTACAVAAMKGCSNPTPGNLADELRTVFFSSMNCLEEKKEA